VLIIVVVGFAAYANTFHAPFQWDGNEYIKNNQIIRNLDFFVHPSEAAGYPYFSKFIMRYATYLTFALDYRISGFNTPVWHLTSIVIHITTALLFFALVLSLFKTPLLKDSKLSDSSQTVAFFCALFFVAHPMQTMAVTYIYQRLASMVAMFYLASLLAYLRWRLAEGGKKRHLLYLACLVLAVIAMKTKENAMTLSAVVLAMELMFFSGPLKRRLLYLVPVFMTIAVFPISYIIAHKMSGSVGHQVGDALNASTYTRYSLERLFVEFKAIVKYLRLYAFPVGQSVMHYTPKVKSFFELGVVLSFALLSSLVAIAVWLFAGWRKRRPEVVLISFGIAWFFITHSMESTIYELPLEIQEYRSYLPSVGMFLSAVTFAMLAISALSSRTARRAALCSMATVALVFAFVTHERNKVWATNMSFWQDAVEKAPQMPAGYINLAGVYNDKGDTEKAASLLAKASELDPLNPRAYNSLGQIYADRGDTGKALELFNKALESDPNSGVAHYNIGTILMTRGETEEAGEHFLKAIEDSPELAGPQSNLGAIYSAKGDYKSALKYLDESVRLHPDYAKGWYNLALVYHKTNSPDRAIEYYKRALAIDDTLDLAQSNLGAIYLSRGDYDNAIRHLAEAVRLLPSDAEVHFDLAYALYKAGRMDKAKAEAKKSLSIDPNYKRPALLLRAIDGQQ